MHCRLLNRWLFMALLGSASSARSQGIVAVSAADFGQGMPTGGSIVTLFLAGLTGVDQIKIGPIGPLPRELAGVSVAIGGRPAPLFAIAPVAGFFQINAQVPIDAVAEGTTMPVRVDQGDLTIRASIPLRSTSPGEFFRLNGAAGIFQRANDGYSLVTASNPGRPGDVLVTYLTGLPAGLPRVADGEPSPAQPLSVVPQYNEIFGSEAFFIVVNGQQVTPLFVGLTPGLMGVHQVNFVLPLATSSSASTTEITLLRLSCRAIFGSCRSGGGATRTMNRSNPVLLPVRWD